MRDFAVRDTTQLRRIDNTIADIEARSESEKLRLAAMLASLKRERSEILRHAGDRRSGAHRFLG